MKKFLPILTFLLTFYGVMSAQDFPVQVTTIVTPPYSLYLSDYASPESNALQVMVQLKELDRPEYRVKLRITIEGQGITLRTKPSYVPRALVLQGGIPEMLTGPDLSGYLNPNNLDFLGTTQQAFMRTGMFPEGFYTFKIEVLDYVRNVVVSNAGLGNAFIILNDPPLINLPFNNDKVIATDPQNIIFSWTPRHSASPNAAFSTEYEFTLVELYPANRNPNDAIRASNSIYVTQTSSTSLNYGVIEPLLIPGRKYAFRIRAFDTNGKDLFKNNGYSEVHVFQYGDACIAPTNVKAEALDPARIKITWDTQDIFTNHGVQFRKEGATDWEEQSTLTNALIIPGLQGNSAYEYTVKGICGTVHGTLSPRSTVVTPSADTAAFACGTPVPEIQLNTTPLQGPLGVFDIIKTADFDIILTEVTVNPDGVSYKGLGRAMIPWFKYAGVRVKFSNIQVNEDKRVYSGNVTTVYTKDSRFVLSADLSGSSVNADSIPDSGAPPAFNGVDTVLTVPVTDITMPTPESPVIVVLLEDGQTVEIPRERNEDGTFKDTRITDANGDTWTVDSAGRIQQGPNVAPPGPLASRDSVNFQVNFGVVDNQYYGFDRKHYVDVPTDKISLNNEDYWIAWKSVETGRQDYVSVTATGKNVFPESIGFKTQNGPVVAEPGSSAAIKRVSVMGLVSEQVESLTAYVRVQAPGQEQAEEVEVGRLNLKAYDKVLKKLIVVPVNGATTPPASTISEELNKIYAQAVVGWDITVEAGITVEQEMITGLDTGESDILASFPDKMLSFVRTFRNDVNRFVDGDAYYIFLVNSPDATSEGFMPFKRQFGFVFTNRATNVITTIAHELGHGAFRFRHTFSPEAKLANEGTTQNLMDYTNPNGRELKKYQWDLVRSPENINGWFEDDGESAYTEESIEQEVARIINYIKCGFISNSPVIDIHYGYSSYSVKVGAITRLLNFTGNGTLASPDFNNARLTLAIGEGAFSNEDVFIGYRDIALNASTLNYEALQKIQISSNAGRLIFRFSNITDVALKESLYNWLRRELGLTGSSSSAFQVNNSRSWRAEEIVLFSDCELSQFNRLNRELILSQLLQQQEGYLGLDRDTYQYLLLRVLETMPSGDKLFFYDFFKNTPERIRKLYSQTSNQNKSKLIRIWLNLWATFYQANKTQIDNGGKLVLTENIFGNASNHALLEENGKVLFLQPYRHGNVTDTHFRVSNPFDNIYLYRPELGVEKPFVTLPAIAAVYFLDTEHIKTWNDLGLAGLQLGLFAVGVGEVVVGLRAASLALQGSGVLSRQFLLAAVKTSIGTADLIASITSSYCSDNTNEFCLNWQRYEFYINLGLLTASVADGIFNKLKQEYPNVRNSLSNENRNILDTEFLTTGVGKSQLLSKLDNFPYLKTWVSSFDDVVDANLVVKIDGLSVVDLGKLNTDIVHSKYGAEIKSLLKESPDDLNDIWKRLKDDPAYSWELQKTGGSRWEKWSQREFFKDVTGKGKFFETETCLTAFKNRSSAKYLELKNKVSADFGKNLDDYDMYSQVQLKYDGDNYFVADQLFVKYKTVAGQKVVDDVIVIENKLSNSTALTTPQANAFQKTTFTVRSISSESEFMPNTFLNQNTVLNFSSSKQWYKVYDGVNGDVISGIQKMQ